MSNYLNGIVMVSVLEMLSARKLFDARQAAIREKRCFRRQKGCREHNG
jgi:hypothetical protein